MTGGDQVVRAYHSPLRKAQAQETRMRILEALVEHIAQPGRVDVSVPEVAAAAGVSTRTVYQHFPDRRAQLTAVADWLDVRLGGAVPAPTSADELPAYIRQTSANFAANESLARAAVSPGLARAVRRERRGQRTAALEQVVRAAAPDPSAPEVRWAAALVKHLIGADTMIPLIDDTGLTIREAGEAVAWAVRALLVALPEASVQNRGK